VETIALITKVKYGVYNFNMIHDIIDDVTNSVYTHIPP